jgi:probable HAF family extracellular repeat protein
LSNAAAGAPPTDPSLQSNFTFTTLDDPASTTFTRLLGLNNLGKLCGYYSTEVSGYPSTGLLVYKGYQQQNFRKEKYPSAVSTVVTTLNNAEMIAGWYVSARNPAWIFGFTEEHGVWNSYRDVQLRKSHTSNVTKLLGLSDSGLAVGYYTDDAAINHPFELELATQKFHGISPPSAVSAVASGINGKGDVVGYLTLANGATKGFLYKGFSFTEFAYPAAVSTQALSLTWNDDIVGLYVDASGNTHGFVLSQVLTSPQWQSVDEDDAVGATVITGVNNHHVIVGYYVAADGSNNGFRGIPKN